MTDVTNYTEVINRLKQEVEAARLHAALTVNKQMLMLYWYIGKNYIVAAGEPGLEN